MTSKIPLGNCLATLADLEPEGRCHRCVQSIINVTRECRPVLDHEAQYAADLDRLDQIEDKNACFFDSMGEFAHERLKGQA